MTEGGHEIERTRELERLEILESVPEAEFDRIARLAAYLVRAPYAGISFLDETRVWFKASVGLQFTELAPEASLCVHTIQAGEAFFVGDIAEDTRFKDNPLFSRHCELGFYFGMPLRSGNKVVIGSLCVFGPEPRDGVSKQEKEGLRELAEEVTDRLERRLAARHKERARECRVQLSEAIREAQDRFIQGAGPETVFPSLLERILAMTRSKHACLVELDTKEQDYRRVGLWNAESSGIISA